jgi:phospholipid/cholesterol/gamma-HCH transport system ATP-binding protein
MDGGAEVAAPEDRPSGSKAASPIVRVRGLVSRFGDVTVHDGVDLDVRRGEVLGLVGGSGAGKSVLLNSIIGLRAPQAGTVEVMGVDVYRDVGEARRELERRWGVLFQNGALFSALSVRENVGAPLVEHTRLSAKLVDGVAEFKIAQTGLPATAGLLQPAELSGGMRKRAGLARAIVMDPELLFLDEPTAGLDPLSAEAFDRLIRELSQTLGLTVLMITHDLDSLYAVCDRVAVIADKKIVAVDRIEMLEKSHHPWIREYFLGPRGRAAHRAAGGV